MAYHGYAARLSDLIASLQKIAAEQPTVIVPARGPVVWNPQETINVLIARIQTLYANYLSIDAHRYYFRRIASSRRAGACWARRAGRVDAGRRDHPTATSLDRADR